MRPLRRKARLAEDLKRPDQVTPRSQTGPGGGGGRGAKGGRKAKRGGAEVRTLLDQGWQPRRELREISRNGMPNTYQVRTQLNRFAVKYYIQDSYERVLPQISAPIF